MERQWVTLVKEPKPPKLPKDRPLRIYFVRCQTTGLVKIGIATDPWMRLSNLQVGCPTQLFMEATVWGTKADEKALHQRFAKHWVRGEWFRPAPDLLAHIEQVKAATP